MSKIDATEIEVNGVKYVPKTSQSNHAINTDGKPFVIVRARDAGCHAGYLESESNGTVDLCQSIRLWYWDGAFTLSQLAEEGVSKPNNCKFGVPVQKHKVINCCEILYATEKGRKSIEGVKPCLK